jgi:hypothetical protein
MAAKPAVAKDVWDRMERAAAVLDQLDRLEIRLKPEELARVDCACLRRCPSRTASARPHAYYRFHSRSL